MKSVTLEYYMMRGITLHAVANFCGQVKSSITVFLGVKACNYHIRQNQLVALSFWIARNQCLAVLKLVVNACGHDSSLKHMVKFSLETRPQGGEKWPGDYCLHLQQFLSS